MREMAMKCPNCEAENLEHPVLCEHCGFRIRDSIGIAADPEGLAVEMFEHVNNILHTRLNYWLVTESILLVAFAGLSGGEPEWQIWTALLLIALAGLTLTFAWFGLFIRSWNWMNHWFQMAQAIHFKRYGEPKDSKSVPLFKVFPREKLFDELGLVRGGLSVKKGGYVMLGVFMSIWAILVLVSVASLLEQM